MQAVAGGCQNDGMTLHTLLLFFLGDREAILTIARSRGALAVGAMFVLSAALARDYDGEDLLIEPWHLIMPFITSFFAAFVLHALANFRLFRVRGQSGTDFFDRFGCFFRLFWMTAPLAWLYAIPYERFLSPLDATRANLTTLAVVSVLRLALMMRVLVVLYGYRWWGAAAVVLPFACLSALFATVILHIPLFTVMGGIRYGERTRLISDFSKGLEVVGFFGGIASVLVFAVLVRLETPKWRLPGPIQFLPTSQGCKWVGAISILFWVPLLILTQPEQRLRTRAEELYHDRKYDEYLRLLDEMPLAAFPPQYEPPPRVWDQRQIDDWRTIELLLFVYDNKPPISAALREALNSKLRQLLGSGSLYAAFDQTAELKRLLSIHPDGKALRALIEQKQPQYAGEIDLARDLPARGIKD